MTISLDLSAIANAIPTNLVAATKEASSNLKLRLRDVGEALFAKFDTKCFKHVRFYAEVEEFKANSGTKMPITAEMKGIVAEPNPLVPFALNVTLEAMQTTAIDAVNAAGDLAEWLPISEADHDALLQYTQVANSAGCTLLVAVEMWPKENGEAGRTLDLQASKLVKHDESGNVAFSATIADIIAEKARNAASPEASQ